MFVIPLGLGTKIKWTPWITTAIMLTWLTNFFIDPFREKMSDQLVNAASKSGIKDAARKLFIDYCMYRQGQSSQCVELSKLIWTGFPGKIEKNKGVKEKSFVMDKILEKEFENASKLRESLKDCSLSKKPKRCIQYKEIFWRFSQITDNFIPRKKNDIISELPSYQSYVSALKDFHSRMLSICKFQDCLTKQNIKPTSIMLAQMRHGGTLHLLGNLVVFLIFAVYVEQKLQPMIFLIGVVMSGSIGMFIHASIWGTPDTFIIGGSTIVSGVIGLFYSLFFHRKLCLRVIVPRKIYLGSNLYLSAKYSIPFLFILTDIAGGINSGYNDMGVSQVAHFAHLTSFICGSLIGVAITFLDKTFCQESYRDSNLDIKKITSAAPSLKTIHMSAQFLEYDSTQEEVMLCGLRSFFICLSKGQIKAGTREGAFARSFASQYAAVFLYKVLRTRQLRSLESSSLVTTEQVVRLFDVIAPQVNLKEFLDDLEPQTLLQLGLILVSKEITGIHGAFYHGLRILDLYMLRFPKSIITPKIYFFATEVLTRFLSQQQEKLNPSPYFAHLKAYVGHHQKSFIGKIWEEYRSTTQEGMKVS